MELHELRKDMRIQMNAQSSKYAGRTGKVLKVLQKNVDLLLDPAYDGALPQRVRAWPGFVEREGDTAALTAAAAPKEIAFPPAFGAVVRVLDPTPKYRAQLEGKYFICYKAGYEVSNVVEIGCTTGQYWRLPNEKLETVKVTVTEAGE